MLFRSRGHIRCPCQKCRNIVFQMLDKMEDHIYINGFDVSYMLWVFHGEGIQLASNLSQESSANLPHIDEDLERDSSDGMEEMLTDIHAGLEGGVAGVKTKNPNIRKTPTSGPKASTPFDKLWEEAEHELYPGCTMFSKLSFTVWLLHVKSESKLSIKAFDMCYS